MTATTLTRTYEPKIYIYITDASMHMRQKHKTNAHRTHLKAGSSTIRRRVEAMARAGLVEDQIAARIGGDKKTLRRKYIDSIKQGRAAKQEAAAEASQLTKQQQRDREVIRETFDYWYAPEVGHLIHEGARTPEEAIEMWENSLRTKHCRMKK